MSDPREDAINAELDAVYRAYEVRMEAANHAYEAAKEPFLREFLHEADKARGEKAAATKEILAKYGLPTGHEGE